MFIIFLHLVTNLLLYFAPLQPNSQSSLPSNSSSSSLLLFKTFFLVTRQLCNCLKRKSFICKKSVDNSWLDYMFRSKNSGRELSKGNEKFQFVEFIL